MRKAFSLAETLVTSFLFLMVLGVAALFLRDYSQIMRQDTEQSQRSQALASLEQIASEARQAIAFVTPPLGSGTAVPVLEFDRMNPRQPHLPTVLPSPLPVSWQPHPGTSLVRVRLEVVGGQLQRRTRQLVGGPAPQTMALLDPCDGLACRFLTNGNLEVVISLLVDGVVQTTRAELQVSVP